MLKRFAPMTCTLSLMAALTLGAPQARAAGEYLGDNSHVQLRAIMASVQGKPGSLIPETRAMTPVMTVPKAGEVAFVCQRAPRAAEAILEYFTKNPAPKLPNGHIDVDKVNAKHADIAAYVNRALGKAVVSEVYLVEGAGEKMATGAAARLPFSSIQGCSRVLEEYEQRMKQLLDGEQKK